MDSRFRLSCTAGAAALILAVALPNVGAGQTPRSGNQPSAKSRISAPGGLDDLSRELLEGLPPRAEGSRPRVAEPADKPTPNSRVATSIVEGKLVEIAQQMRDTSRRIAQADTSQATQRAQQKIVNDLAALLDEENSEGGGGKAETAGQGTTQAGAGSGDPGAGGRTNSTGRVVPGSKVEPETGDVKDLVRRAWGHLPDKLRDQMHASLSEQFLPKYERLIEEYYKRLAEEEAGRP